MLLDRITTKIGGAVDLPASIRWLQNILKLLLRIWQRKSILTLPHINTELAAIQGKWNKQKKSKFFYVQTEASIGWQHLLM